MPEPGQLKRPHRGLPEEAESNDDGPSGSELDGPAFRISVDLSEYFQQPSHCFLWVPRPREARTVRWLARRLRTAAALRERFCLLCAAHTLPPDEPLRLLRPGDSLRVVRVEHEWQRVFSFRGERPPTALPKSKKRPHIDPVNAEPPPTRVPGSKPNPSRLSQSLPSPQQPTPLAAVSFPPSEMSISLSAMSRLSQLSSTDKSARPNPPSALSFSPSESTELPSKLPKLSQASSTPKPALSNTATTSPLITKPPSQDEELQRVKRRALSLLQKVESKTSLRSQERGNEGEDEVDGASAWSPKKRRRRVRKRRALPPIDFEQELALTTAQLTPAQTTSLEVPGPVTPKPLLISTSELYSTPNTTYVRSLAPPIPVPSIFAPPSIPVASLSLPPPGPVVMREATTPRPPRLVRALDATRTDDVNRPSIEHNVSATPTLLPQTAVQCS